MSVGNRVAKLLSLLTLFIGVFGFTSVYAGGSYSENFDDGAAQGWTTSGGTWSVTGAYYNESDTVQNAISVYGTTSWSTDFTYSVKLYSQYGSSGNMVAAIYDYQDGNNYYEARINSQGTAWLYKVVNGTESVVATGSYAAGGAGTWVQVQIARSGQNTSVNINGAAVFTNVVQTEFSSGEIGVISHWDLARFDDVSVTDGYNENFDAGTAVGWTPTSGTWSVTGGYYAETQSPVQQNAISVYNGASWSGDVNITARLYSQYGGTGNSVALIYNYQDSLNYYEARFNPQGTGWLIKVVNGTETQVATATVPVVGAGQWFLVQVMRTGQQTSVLFNGQPAFSNVVQTEYTGGKIGLASHWDLARFDDVAVTTGSKYKNTFPKLGMVLNAPPFNYGDSTYQAQIAKLDLAVLGMYRGWNGGTARNAVQAIKALNPRILVGNYTILQRQAVNVDSTSAEYDIKVKLDSEKGPSGIGNWWAYVKKSDGTYSKAGDSGHPDVNITSYVTADANGDRFPQWLAKRNNQYLFATVPEFDIWFTDNIFYKPRVTADWDRNGTNDSPTNSTVAAYYRAGNAAYWSAIRSAAPNVLIMGNIDGDGVSQSGYLRETEYRGKIEAAILEGVIGTSYGDENHGWNVAMDSYRSLINNTIAPHLVLFNVHADSTASDHDRYKRMRYGLASTLMDDGYYSFTDGYHDVLWFDEYDAPLGAAVDSPPTQAWSNGVYMRKFQNGLALVNPKGNGAKTVTVPTGYKHISGNQWPAVNDGQPVTTVSLEDSDGVILIKQ